MFKKVTKKFRKFIFLDMFCGYDEVCAIHYEFFMPSEIMHFYDVKYNVFL
jgi:hypothetical protein